MHFISSLATAVIVVAPLVASQSLSDLQALPSCAQTPAETAFAATGCGLNQPACVCKNADFQTSLTNEVMKDCSQTDQVAVLKFSTNFCAKAGITVNVPQTTEAAAQAALNPTPAPASSAPPPPPPPPSSSALPAPPSSSSAGTSSLSSVASIASSTSVSSKVTSTQSSKTQVKTTPLSSVIPSTSSKVTKAYSTLKTTAFGQALHPYPTASSILAYNGSNSSNYGGTVLSFTGAASTKSASLVMGLSLIVGVLAFSVL